MFRLVKNSLLKKLGLSLLVLSLLPGMVGCAEQAENQPTVTSKDTATCTMTPGSTTTPTPDDTSSAPLFDAAYYAVLSGEGAYYYVYDCYGKVVDGFQNISDSWFDVAGLYPKDSICFAQNFATLHDINRGKAEEGRFTVNVTEHFYWTYDCYTGQICVYDKQDNLFYETTAYPEEEYGYWFMASGVLEVPDGLIVYVCDAWEEGMPNMEPPVLVRRDGSVTKLELPENVRLTGVLGTEYLVVKMVAESWENGTYAICDYNGNILVQDIVPIMQSCSHINEDAPLMGVFSLVANAYVYEKQIYGADLQQMDAQLPAEFADMQYAVYWGDEYVSDATYTVDGVSYQADADGTCLYGVKDGTLYLKYNGKTYTMECAPDIQVSCTVNAVNPVFVHVQGEEHQYVFRLADKTCIAQFAQGYVTLQDTYFLLYQTDENNVTSVYDGNGTLRYQTDKNEIVATAGDYMVLRRGSYIGIADLDGNYILKTIVPELVSDSVREEVW